MLDIETEIYEDTKQWAITIYFTTDVITLPKVGVFGNEVTEVVSFNSENIPDKFGWWEVEDLRELLAKYENH